MTKLSNEVVDKIVTSCIDLFKKLPKNGKPVEKEWTVLSCIVKYNIISGNIEVVSLGTGSKCIGATKMAPKGTLLNDSHAEVFARRSFLIYLYENIIKTLNNEDTIFIKDGCKFKLKDNIEFVFYSSQLPCGDASIIPKAGEVEQFGDVLQSNKHPSSKEDPSVNSKKLKLDDDVYRTGAKCLLDCEQDPKEEGVNYHLLGQVRTKPGRGDRTLSVSCSDKMARWIHMGIQGALLDMLLVESIFIKHFVFGAGVPFSEETLNRAFLKRHLETNSDHCAIEIYQSSVIFDLAKSKNHVRPSPGSIVWMHSKNGSTEVAVQGKKLGVTKCKMNSPSQSLSISKYKLYEKFQTILSQSTEIRENILGDSPNKNLPYNEMKKKSIKYQERWCELKKSFFRVWTVKPDMWNFTIDQ